MKMVNSKVIAFWELLKMAGSIFMRNHVPKLSASLAYYTIFSMGPMIMVIIFLANLFFEQQAVEGAIYDQIKEFVGSNAAEQIESIIKSASPEQSNAMAIISIVALIIAATTVFADIQNSINQLWRLKAKAGKGLIKLLITRLTSFSLVAALGFLLMVSLLINTAVEGLMSRLQEIFPQRSVTIAYILNLVITFCIITVLFAIIFKVLPDAVIRWKDVFAGAVFTALLFMAGKFIISFYIGKADIGSSYGAAGSLVVLVLWVYLSSLVLYFGAAFTKAYAFKYGGTIKPNDFAVAIQVVELETTNQDLKQNEDEEQAVQVSMQKEKDDEEKRRS